MIIYVNVCQYENISQSHMHCNTSQSAWGKKVIIYMILMMTYNIIIIIL